MHKNQLGAILYSIKRVLSASLTLPHSCLHSALKFSIRPQLLFIFNRISEIIFFGLNLACPNANKILPFELCELGMIYLVFHVTLLFFREFAAGIDLQSSTINSLFKQTLMSKSQILCFHFQFILYLKVNSMFVLFTYIVQMKRRGIFSGLKVYVLRT